MMARFFPLLWFIGFVAALMPFAAYEAHGVFAAVTLTVLGLAFAVLKGDLPERMAPVTWVFLPLFMFWGLALLSAGLSEIPYVSFIYFCVFSLFPLSLCCAIAARNKAWFFGVAGAGLYLVYAALAVWCLLQFFVLPERLSFGRTYWPFADPNSLGGFLALGVFGGVGLMIAGGRRLYSNAGLVLAILVFAALLSTGSRGAIVALAGGIAVFAWLAWPQIKRHKRCSIILAASVALSVFLLQFHSASQVGSAAGRIANTIGGAEPVLWDRPALWTGAVEIAKSHFWTGTGIGTFYLYYPEVRGGDVMSAGRMAHSDPLQFWAEMGIFAPVLFYVFGATAIFLTIRALGQLPKGDMRRVHILVPFCAMAAFAAQAHVNFPFNILPLLMMAGLLTGYWFWRVSEALDGEWGRLKPLRLPGEEMLKVMLIAPLLLGGYGFAMLQGSHIVYDRGDARGQAGDMAGFAADINKADRMAQHKNDRAILMAARLNITALEMQGGLGNENSQGTFNEAQALLNKVEELNPRQPAVPHMRARLAHLAALLGLSGGGGQERLLLEALALNPLYYPARVDLADYYVRTKQREKAYETLKEGLKWREAAIVPREFYEALAREAVTQGDHETTAIALKRLRSGSR
jgi:O-antigen ligase